MKYINEMQVAAQGVDFEVEEMSMEEIGTLLWRAAKAASNAGYTLDECFESVEPEEEDVDTGEAVSLDEALDWTRRQK